MEAMFCVDCLKDAMREHGNPEVFNSDQGTQFTSEAFTGLLKRKKITISMNGRGRAFDNIFVGRLWRSVKHEDVYLNGYATMEELLIGLTKYFVVLQRRTSSPSTGKLHAGCGAYKPGRWWCLDRGQVRCNAGTPHCASLHGD